MIADGAIRAGSVEVDEALLTGESASVRRHAGNELRAGVFCVAGECRYRADRIGAEAYAQRLTSEARDLVRRPSPLLQRFERLLRAILIATGLLATILFIQFNVEHRGFAESLKATTATVTTVVPVGLLLGITVVTAVGALRVSRSGAIVHDLNTVEALNYVDVIAFDKTGTLTSNRLVLDGIHWSPGREVDADWLRAFAAATAGESGTSTALAAGLGAGRAVRGHRSADLSDLSREARARLLPFARFQQLDRKRARAADNAAGGGLGRLRAAVLDVIDELFP